MITNKLNRLPIANLKFFPWSNWLCYFKSTYKLSTKYKCEWLYENKNICPTFEITNINW